MYPALAVLQALENKTSEVLWIGSQSGMEQALLKSYNLDFETIPAAGLHGVGFWSLPGNLDQLIRGWREAKAIINRFKPHAMFFTGGYLGVPVAFAGKDIPSVVFIPDIEPGLALKTIIRYAKNIAVVSDRSKDFLGNKPAQITGYPVRKDLKKWNRAAGRKYLNIPEGAPVLFVFGGSKGARSINQALLKYLPELLKEMHIIHISGMDNWTAVKERVELIDSDTLKRYHGYPFLHEEMGAAFAAADLAICRSGASTLGELPFFGLPAILVPYPHTWRYQHQNAEYLHENGGAIIVENGALQFELPGKVKSLMENPSRLAEMGKAMKKFSVPNAADQIADMILQTGELATFKEVFYG